MAEAPSIVPADIRAAADRIRPYVRRTPLEYSSALSQHAGVDVYLKMECWQLTGSFKPRISFNKLLTLTPDARARGVIASTAGGHGLGLSHAARTLGVTAHIYLPRNADDGKVMAMRRNGAMLTFFESVEEARGAALTEAARSRLIFISAYNDADIIAGGGTVGLEIVEDLPDVATLVTGIGGGGLISGCAIAIGAERPRLDVRGVQPENSAVLARWVEAGKPVDVAWEPSIADGLGALIEADSITFPLVQRHAGRMELVSEDEIRGAMAWALEQHQLVLEPSGAAPIAALLRQSADAGPGGEHPRPIAGPVAVILTGRNIGRARFEELIRGF
ncbi:MAG TPA: pyridoxal-phosphate dependent enzyme [Gemmatimonadales bacterium]|nr:pyridoxal-phosphate dependent enzyme [Gemmatimonadales bacterium]